FISLCPLFFSFSADHLDLHSFPTRRSSDLGEVVRDVAIAALYAKGGRERLHDPLDRDVLGQHLQVLGRRRRAPDTILNLQVLSQDRKSTRLNSSHVEISYAVFCLKKKKEKH